MMRSRVLLLALFLLTVGALIFRSVDLGNRPFHQDEAVHALKFKELWQEGSYEYDPNEYHGPTIYYAALPSVLLNGRQSFADTREADYRLPVALMGAAMVLLLFPLADGLGRRAALWAGLLTAISPAFVFYSRYFIQEVPLVFFTLGLIVCGWRYYQSRRPDWLIGAGVCAGLMIATKETAILTFFAMGAALALTHLWTRWMGDAPRPSPDATRDTLTPHRLWNPKWMTFAVGAALLTACLFISGFFTHPAGILDYPRAYAYWGNRAQSTHIHDHPWYYYFQLLLWFRRPEMQGAMKYPFAPGPVCSEALIVVLALIGAGLALRKSASPMGEGNPMLWRFLAFYTLLLTLIYGVIPYKTPWCLLSFLDGMILLAGIAWSALSGKSELRQVTVGLLLLAVCAQLGWQAYRGSFINYADIHNPYVYAATSADVVELEQKVEALAQSWPEHEKMAILVFSVDNHYWPLPWYLRRFPNVGYCTQPPANDTEGVREWNQDLAEAPRVPVVLAAYDLDDIMDSKLHDTHLMNGINQLRLNQSEGGGSHYERWIRMDVWLAYLKAHPPPRTP